MASKNKVNSNLVRIDDELIKMIDEVSKKNQINFRQASREIAIINRKKFSNKTIMKEIKF